MLMIKPACVLLFSVTAIRNVILVCWRDSLVIVSDLSCAVAHPFLWARETFHHTPGHRQWTRASPSHFCCCSSCKSESEADLCHKKCQHSHLQLVGWCWPLICLICSGYQRRQISSDDFSLFLEQERIFLLIFLCKLLNSL